MPKTFKKIQKEGQNYIEETESIIKATLKSFFEIQSRITDLERCILNLQEEKKQLEDLLKIS